MLKEILLPHTLLCVEIDEVIGIEADTMCSFGNSPPFAQRSWREHVPVIDAGSVVAVTGAPVTKQLVVHAPRAETCPVGGHVCWEDKLQVACFAIHLQAVTLHAVQLCDGECQIVQHVHSVILANVDSDRKV